MKDIQGIIAHSLDEARWELEQFLDVVQHGAEMTPDGPEFDRFVELVQSPTDAVIVPEEYIRYLKRCMLPYVYGEKGWDDCWNSFMSTLELYKDE